MGSIKGVKHMTCVIVLSVMPIQSVGHMTNSAATLGCIMYS
ncbi:hypothetical protein [Bacillus sp. SA1-12]|nr:hypothetical protein [Bacillus sp. SA1-12]